MQQPPPQTARSIADAKTAQDYGRLQDIASALANACDVNLRGAPIPTRLHFIKIARVALKLAQKGPGL